MPSVQPQWVQIWWRSRSPSESRSPKSEIRIHWIIELPTDFDEILRRAGVWPRDQLIITFWWRSASLSESGSPFRITIYYAGVLWVLLVFNCIFLSHRLFTVLLFVNFLSGSVPCSRRLDYSGFCDQLLSAYATLLSCWHYCKLIRQVSAQFEHTDRYSICTPHSLGFNFCDLES